MHVKLLIGQRAGQIVDLPPHAATNLLMTGQAQDPTEAEIAAAMEANRISMKPKQAPDADEPGTVIHEMRDGPGAGLKIVAAGGGKFNVLGIDGKPLNDAPLARSEASLLAAAQPKAKSPPASEPEAMPPVDDAQSDPDGSSKKPQGKRG